MSLIFISLGLTVHAATVTFDPILAELEVMPGETGKATINVTAFSRVPGYFLSFKVGSKVKTGSKIDPKWLIPTDVSLTSARGGTSTSTVNLEVNIPPEVEPGTYSGQILPEDLGSTESITSEGITVFIDVVDSRTTCSGPPRISVTGVQPANAWAPTDRDVEINITGVIEVAEGCEIAKAGYTLQSNNDPVKDDITLGPGGVFSETAKINISRSGTDKSGRVFEGTVNAEDVEGNQATVNFSVTVLHDRGNTAEAKSSKTK